MLPAFRCVFIAQLVSLQAISLGLFLSIAAVNFKAVNLLGDLTEHLLEFFLFPNPGYLFLSQFFEFAPHVDLQQILLLRFVAGLYSFSVSAFYRSGFLGSSELLG